MFYGDLGTDYSHFNGFLWEINVRKTNFSTYAHFLGTNYKGQVKNKVPKIFAGIRHFLLT